MKKHDLSRILLGLLWIVGLLSPALSQAQETAVVSLPSISIPEGLTVNIKVSISGVSGAGLSDFQGRLNFDATVVQISRVTGLNGYTVFASALDNQAGEVRFVVAKTNTPFLQQGEILEFTLSAVGAINSSSNLALTLTTFNDTNGVFIPHTMNNGRVTVVARQPLAANFSFSPTTPLINQGVQFTDQTPLTQGTSLEAWNWNFGDGTTSLEQNPTHVFTRPGTFAVQLTVTDNFNRSNTASQQVTVIESEPTDVGTVLLHSFPQPAKTSVTIIFQIPNSTQTANLFIYSSKGELVLQNTALNVQSGRFQWNLIGIDQNPVPNGAYFYVVIAFNADGQGIGRGSGKLIVQR